MKALEEMGKFATVVIDPPWHMDAVGWRDTKGDEWGDPKGELPYGTLKLEGIKQLPVGDVLANDAFLFCWTINRYLFDTRDLIEGWGVGYSFTMTWHKSGGFQLPGGPSFNAEWCVVGRKGQPQFNETKAFSTCNNWTRSKHSAKPEGFYDLLRRVTPGPRLDIFGRRRIAGFTSWGNEAPEGDPLPDHYQTVLLDA